METMTRLLVRALALVIATLGTTFVALVPGAAQACACGGAYPPEDTELVAGDETVFLSRTEDGRERMEMGLELTGDTKDVAVLVPTPAVPEVTQGSAARLAELDELSTPPPEPEEYEGDGDGAGAPPTGAPEILDQVVLDDVVATVLRGGTAEGVVNWLADNGYAQKPTVEPVIAEYLADDWIFTAIKLRTDVPVSGRVDPVVLTFVSEALVYPMRMSSVAEDPGSVTAYVLADEFVDFDAEGDQVQELVHLLRVDADDVEDELLSELVARGDTALTRWQVDVSDPEELDDFTFVANASLETEADTSTATGSGDDSGDDSGTGLSGEVVTALVIGLLTVLLGGVLFGAARRRS